jgi:hypothetical protein
MIAAVAGCASAQPGLPITPSSAAVASASPSERRIGDKEQRASWIAPDAQGQDLLYVSDNDSVAVYSYPQGRLERTLRGGFYLATGECVDKNGNVFIVNVGNAKIFEYAHGGTKRLATLVSPTRDPVGCGVDPLSGNLAVASEGFGSSATVAVFKQARGKPTLYEDKDFYQFYFCGYDDKGNLYVDGLTAAGSGHFGLAELPAGQSQLSNVSVDQYVRFPGGVQWDGKYLAIGDQFDDVYEFSINAGKGTLEGTTELGSGARYVKQFWIQGSTIIAPNVYIKGGAHSNVLFYNYPAGGKATKKITDGIKDAQGAVVSPASS